MDHFGSSISLLEIVGHCNRIKTPVELSPKTTDGYFQVIAEPVSTVSKKFLRFLANPSFVTKLYTHLTFFPGYQFCTVEYFFRHHQAQLIRLLQRAIDFRHDLGRTTF
jgi:hypothetical protein